MDRDTLDQPVRTKQDIVDRRMNRASIAQIFVGGLLSAAGVWVARHTDAVKFNFDVAIWTGMFVAVLAGLLLQIRSVRRRNGNRNVLRGYLGFAASAGMALAAKLTGETGTVVLSGMSILFAAVATLFFIRGSGEIRRDIAD